MKTCQYQLSDGTCGAPIVENQFSYSGFDHARLKDEAGQKINWLHWASPTPYGHGLQQTKHIFKKCIVCGKTGPENEAHMRYDGHRFQAEQGERGER